MPIPDYQSVMLPLLKYVDKNGKTTLKEAYEEISNQFNLTDAERAELLPSGTMTIIRNRVGWARTYLLKSGLLYSERRGESQITQRGKDLLLENPTAINVKLLKRYPEFLEFQNLSLQGFNKTTKTTLSESSGQTPEELLEESYHELKTELLDNILSKTKACSPSFFERLVVDVIVKMGYGGSLKEAGQAIGRSGDEGIDGIINEDRLGLDVIYLQAKRWDGNVSRPEIQKFAGALQGKRARKGIFITTSDFTAEAREFVKNIDSKIVLLNGKQLADLMFEYNIGVSPSANYEVKKIDMDFFTE